MKSVILGLSLLISVSALAKSESLTRENCNIYPSYSRSIQYLSLDVALEKKGYEVVKYQRDASLIWTYDHKNMSKVKETLFSGETYSYLTYELKLKDLDNKENIYHANGRLINTVPKVLGKSEVTYKTWHYSNSHRGLDIVENEIEAIQETIKKLPNCKLKH